MKGGTRSKSEQGLSMGCFMNGFGLNLVQERYGDCSRTSFLCLDLGFFQQAVGQSGIRLSDH
jgi:hypothetical protein